MNIRYSIFTIVIEYFDSVKEIDCLKTLKIRDTPTGARRLAKRMLLDLWNGNDGFIPEVVRVENSDEKIIVRYNWDSSKNKPVLFNG